MQNRKFEQIVFVAAMEEEIDAIERAIPKTLLDQVTFIKSGVGKVNAAVALACLGDIINPDCLIINVGTAGSLDPSVNIGDIVISNTTIQHDVDVCALGYSPSEIPFNDKSIWVADKTMVKQAEKICIKHSNTHIGTILTGDQFIADAKQRRKLHEYHQGLCVDMEGAAIAATCHKLGVNWLIIRAISDNADSSSPSNFAPNAQKLETLFGNIATDLARTFLNTKEPESQQDSRRLYIVS